MTFDWINPRGLCLNPSYGSCIAACDKRPELGKHIETRGYWPYDFKGTLFIHQTKGLGEMYSDESDLADHCAEWPFCEALEAMGYTRADQLPRGKVVAVARLVAAVPTASLSDDGFYSGPRSVETGVVRLWKLTDRERAMGNYAPGRYALLLADIRALPEPVTCRGMQGLWVPDAATIARVREQVVSE